MKINILKIFLIGFLSIETIQFVHSQSDSIPIFSKFKLETRFDFDNIYTQEHTPAALENHSHDYGFTGKYLNFILAGNINSHFSYFFRQRIIPKPGVPNLFDNTDFLYLKWNINKKFAITTGKQSLHIGSFEYDASPIDVYFYTNFWNNIACFQLGVTASYTDKAEKNTLLLQMTNSPYIYNSDNLSERFFGKGIFAYSFAWYGNYRHFKTIYSINMLEMERGKFINYICLGNKLDFKRVSFYFDYLNKAASLNHFFADFTMVSRIDVKLGKSFVLFVKGGYEQNHAESPQSTHPLDIMMKPGYSNTFGGFGLEFRPACYQALRLHAYAAYKNEQLTHPKPHDSNYTEYWNANVGISWDLNFLKFIHKNKLKEKNN